MFLPNNYKIVNEGAVKYITNSKGAAVSNRYHEFDNFEFAGTKRLIGQSGSQKYILRIPLNEDDFFKELTYGEQNFIIKDGLLFGKSGTALREINL